MLRTSSYTIYVDLPDNQREMLLVHGYTGAYDKVSRQVADYLRHKEAKRAPKPLYGDWNQKKGKPEAVAEPAPEILRSLKRRGYLTDLDPQNEVLFFAGLVDRLHARERQQAPTYIFMPTYDCNLRCGYCFQSHMREDERFAHLLGAMQPAMLDRIFAALPRIEARHGLTGDKALRRRNIGLFGGEPLLAAQRAIVEQILERAFDLGEADVWAVTNGTELEAYRDLLGPGKIARLQITIDGSPAEHDKRRVYADGSPTFERIARNLEMAMALGTRVQIRFNLDRKNLADLPQIADEIIARGWDQQTEFSAYTAPINAANEKTDKSTTFNSWQLDQALRELMQQHPQVRVLGRPDDGIRHRARQIFDGAEEPIPQLRPSFCSAHDRMYIFDPMGNVYACWERTGDAKIRIARITPDGDIEFRFEQHQAWRNRTVASNPVCRQCRYALHCGGGCAVLALEQSGKLHANYCDGFASRFRSSIAEAFLAHLANEKPSREHDSLCDQ